MARWGILTSATKAAAATLLIMSASLLTAAAVTVLADVSKHLATVVVVAGLATAVGLVTIARYED